MSITYRLYQPDDLEQTLGLVNRIFQQSDPTIPAQAWARLEAGDHVTVLAEEHDRVVGAIPFDLRDLVLRPGLEIRAAFAHCVGVDEALRGLGVGTGMMAYARKALQTVADGLFVYTDGEGRAPHTFYRRNGFVDLHYSRAYTLSSPGGKVPAGVHVAPLDPAAPDARALDRAFRAVYGQMAGFPAHGPDYWRRALGGIIYVQMPRDFCLAWAEDAGRPAGYALSGLRLGEATVLEMAADPGVARRLLQAVAATAARCGAARVTMYASNHHPAQAGLLALGFRPEAREGATVVAGQVLSLERLWIGLTAGFRAPALSVWTPKRRIELPGQGPPVTLEMKEATLQRLFLCRVDVAAALHSEAVTSPAHELPLQELGEVFRPAPWVHHALEWI